jgi:hypothetical protein
MHALYTQKRAKEPEDVHRIHKHAWATPGCPARRGNRSLLCVSRSLLTQSTQQGEGKGHLGGPELLSRKVALGLAQRQYGKGEALKKWGKISFNI